MKNKIKNKIKNKKVVNLVNRVGKIYEEYYKMKNEVEKEYDYWSDEKNWSKFNNSDEDYGMRLSVMFNMMKE